MDESGMGRWSHGIQVKKRFPRHGARPLRRSNPGIRGWWMDAVIDDFAFPPLRNTYLLHA